MNHSSEKPNPPDPAPAPGKHPLSPEEALRRSERKYQSLVESLQRDYIIYSHDPDGNFTYISPSIVNVLGYTPDEFRGHYTRFLTDSPVNRDVEAHTRASLRGEKQEPFEAEFRHKDGRAILLRTTETPVFNEDGTLQGVEGIVQDITAARQAEAEREKLIRKLEQALKEVKTLSGLLPICAGCKKIRDDQGYWHHVESYVMEHSQAQFSHGFCPECYQREMDQLNRPGPGTE